MAINVSSGNYLSRTTNLISYNAAYTVMAWIYPNSLSAGCVFTLKESTAYDFWGFLSGTYYLEVADISGAESAFPSVVGVSQWIHFAAVRSSASAVQCYQNGVSITSPANRNIAGRSANNEMLLGRFNTAFPNTFNGAYSDYFAYDRALTQAEIQQQMYMRIPQNTSNLVDWCPFLDNSINVSGGASAWTVTGSPTYTQGLLLGAPSLLMPRKSVIVPPTYYARPESMLLAC